MEDRTAETGAMYRRAVDRLNQQMQSPPQTEALYQFVMNSGYAVIAGERKYRHTLQLMFNHKEAIRFAQTLLEELNDPEDWPLVVIELHGKMIVEELGGDDD